MKYLLSCLFVIISTIAIAQNQYKFNHFTTDEGLPSNSIYSITEDKKGNIVLGTDNGLTFFDGNDFTNYNIKEGLINPYITAVSTDESGVIWFINYNGKLQKFENNKIVNTPIFTDTYNQLFNLKDKLFLYTIQNRFSNKCYGYNQITKNTWQILRPKNGIISKRIAPPLLVQDNKEIIFDNNNLIYNNVKVPIPDEVKFLHKVIFRKNDVCLLDENFLFLVDYKGIITNKIKLPQPLSVSPIYKYDFIVDQQENCWLSIQSKGLFVLKNNKWNSISENLGLSISDNVNFLCCDRKGKIWIATNEKGLYCIPNVNISSIQFKNQENYFNGFANSIDPKSLFISTKFSLYSYSKKELNLLEKSILEIKIGNYNTIPVFYTPVKTETNWNKERKLLTVTGKQIIKSDNDKHYILAGNSSINIFEKRSISFKSINAKIPKKEKIKQIVLYKNEYYFNNAEKINIRTFDDDFIYNKRELKFKIKGYIEDFVFINDTMWIASNNAVFKVYKEQIVDSISEVNGIKLDNIHKIKLLEDGVFLCAGNGLFKISKTGNRVLNRYNFLPNNDVYNVALSENELLVATKNGLGKISYNLVKKNSDKPIFNIFYYSKKIKKLVIDSELNSIKISLKIQNFQSTKNQLIQYKIDDTPWIVSQGKNLYFQSLSYGNHTIFVRVRDVNSNWSTKTISVYKSFPFYLKWWFILFSNILLVALIYGIYTYQIKKIKAKKQQEIETNNKIVELRQNALSAMMNPHFVFNSLNAIQYFVNSNQKQQSSEHLGKLARLVRLFLSQASEPLISISDEINRLKLYLELEQVRFMNFDFTFNIDENIDMHQTKIPNMIVQPFIENAILHGVSHLTEKDGKIDLNFNLDKKILTIEVIDNGFGLDKNKQKTDVHISKGIAIISERIEILQQSYPEKTFSISQEVAFPDAARKGHKVIILVTILD
ncbi:histidine kinase [Flavobacterium sp.]|uniref:sensor histidine kinase n=1 Tax=Flavobacterium sp. TaxID=239 RepID=UPI00286EAA4D|nr:histidine kinase [Flavobacterium sp.]